MYNLDSIKFVVFEKYLLFTFPYGAVLN